MYQSVKSKRVVIVDSQAIARLGLHTLLAPSLCEIVGEANDGAAGTELVETLKPDLIVLDPSLHDVDGISCLPQWRHLGFQGYIFILTSRSGSHEIGRALAAGVHGYMFKDAPLPDMLMAIDIVAQGGRFVPADVGRKTEHAATQIRLTTREQEVLLWLARGQPYDAIGKELGVQTETVRSHTKNIMGKLGMKSRNEAVALSLRTGLIRLDSL